ncbi:AzlC family ABC transporter permease [Pseudodesulfovibrio senegalensis]|uniref:AzlC family ABC transporter permease n=2 Tax=Pseudodesulfovibrio senegalensis TaxID=1721087 RepID=A0A6N6N4F7_9BACT|nr:AzlC family ABC transporter permease [Pseudodesulfovibrio senegalensis]
MEQVMENGTSTWSEAFRRVAPLAMGYLPVGVAFGVLAQKAGLSDLNVVLMSLLVYAGSAQLIAVGMFAAGMPPLTIVVTTFVVNLRHLLMSAALAPYAKSWRLREMAAFSFELTDETFAVHSTRFNDGDVRKPLSFRINMLAHCVWTLASWGGALAGSTIPDVKPLGMDFALPAMFIALLAMQAKNGLHWLVAGFSGLVAVVLMQAGLDQWSVIAATVLGATLGTGVETWTRR